MMPQPLGTLVLITAGGIFCLVIAHKIKIPAIIFLLLYGMAFGPDFLNVIQPSFIEPLFEPVVSLLVALVLFEGGASLKFSQYREISLPLKGLLTVGALITLAVGTAAAYLLAGMEWRQALLFGSIMIVTGPTVVSPILQRLRVKPPLHNILQWEATLIDPLGVIVSVVVFELFFHDHIGLLEGLSSFGLRILVGGLLGLVSGWTMGQALGRAKLLKFESEELGGLFLLGTNLFFYGLSEWFVPHSGLVTAVTAGVIVGNRPIASHDQVFQFEKQITLFALSVLFIIISSTIPTASLSAHFKTGMAVLAVMILIGRPLSVFLSTAPGKSLSFMDRVFISSVAPRGIVSASLAALFAFSMRSETSASFDLFLPFSFIVIIGTILFYSLFPFLTARHPSIKETPRREVLIIGANSFALRFAQELKRYGTPVSFIDINPAFCARARKQGFRARKGSATDLDYLSSLNLKDVGHALALTPNHELNVLACRTLSKIVGKKNVYRLWGKPDSWETAASPNYDMEWGRPLAGSFQAPYLALWEKAWRGVDPLGKDRPWPFIGKPSSLTGWTVQASGLFDNMKVTQDSLAEAGYHFPLFVFLEDTLFFVTPDEDLPKGANVVHATPQGEKAQAPVHSPQPKRAKN